MASGSGGEKKLSLQIPKKDSHEKKTKLSPSKIAALKKVKSHMVAHWDPLGSSDWDQAGEPGPLASSRIKRDLTSLYKEPLPGIFILPDETNFCIVHCLIIGPFDTPYEGGFFNFVVRFGPSYPLHPPRVRFLTTAAGTVRFNPNLYSNGKVCLSILGTWTGPAWSPASNLGSLLLSIQSLLNEKPYFNEPGFQAEHFSGESNKYNDFVIHETIRVAVCCHMENALNENTKFTQKEFVTVARSTFLDFYDHYINTCKKKKHLDKTDMKDIFSMQNVKFNFGSLIARLEAIKEKVKVLDIADGTNIGRDSPLSTISDTSDDNCKAKDSAALISEANEFGLTEEEELEVNAASGTSSDSPSSCENKTKNSHQETSDDWFFIDDDDDVEDDQELPSE